MYDMWTYKGVYIKFTSCKHNTRFRRKKKRKRRTIMKKIDLVENKNG